MAVNTDRTLRNQVMYQIFPRNYSNEGTFRAVERDLDRIQDLGTDIIWFTPIHPIGEKNRKGTLGSPYAIKDYRAVNPEFGDEEDLKRLVDAIHARGMKCIIDVVYNHTSPDSKLASEHPEWFYHREDGSFGNRVADWSDVIDLDYANKGLWKYQIDTLKKWAGIVDGFRCDVAPLVPLEFWLEARSAVEEVRPGAIWLCESVEPRFITYMRGRGLNALSDSELYQAFDISYDYDIFDDFEAYFDRKGTLGQYAESVNRQEYIYPGNYVKLRFLENHDRRRAASYLGNVAALRNATAFVFFQKGLTLLYAGQEYGVSRLPGLFDKDVVPWEDEANTDLTGLIKKMSEIRKAPLLANSSYHVWAVDEDVLCAAHSAISFDENADRKIMAGFFSFSGRPCTVSIPKEQGRPLLRDGVYNDLITGEPVTVTEGKIRLDGEPVIIG